MAHENLRDNSRLSLKVLSPFGIGQDKPRHFRDMVKIMWENRDNLGYASKILTQGVCDGCALGVAGLHDWTIKGVHLCMTRLNLLRLNTMPAMDHSLLEDVSDLKTFSNKRLRKLGRLAYPMYRKRGDKGFTRITWDDAIARIANKIRESNPNRTSFFLTSRGVTNEIYYVAQKAARFIGTNNVDNAARLCHAPSTGAMKAAIGYAASTCSYKDWYGTDLIIFFGSNPANDQPVAMKYLEGAKKLGTKVVIVNPFKEPGMIRYWVPSSVQSALFGTAIADYWFPVNQGGDIAFIYGVLKILFENNWMNQSFIDQHTVDIGELKSRALSLDWDELVRQSGQSKQDMQAFAELIRDAKNAVFVWSMGITQHVFGADAVRMILNLGLVRGYVGKDKNGLMPIRGHSSVQGGAEMGAYATAFPGGKPINNDNARALESQYGFPIADKPGLTSAEMVEACHRKELDVLYCVGGNFLRTLPDPDYVTEALDRVPLRVHQDIILTDQMFIEGDEVILLPAQTRYEQTDGGIETTTERRIVFSPEIPRQVGEARAEWKILRDLAIAVHPERAQLFGCGSGQAIREEIARIVPFYDGVQNLKKSGDQFQYGGPHLCADGKFGTIDGKAHFQLVELPRITSADAPKGWFKCSTRRGKQFNTLIYAEIDPITGAPRDAVFISPDDASDLHLKNGDAVTLVNDLGRMDGTIFFGPIARGNLQIHWPEGNVLLSRDLRDPVGGVPDYNAFVKIEKRIS